jgi:hypothetical protein
MTSFGWVVVSERLQVATYPQPVDAEPSTIRLLVVDVDEDAEEEVDEDAEEEVDEDVVDVEGLITSTMTPRSLGCEMPNDSVAEVSALASTWYWAYTSCPALVACMSVIPPPAVCSVDPVSPPTWNTKEPAGAETPVLHGLAQLMLACDSGSPAKGLTVFAPETANATTPYQVSPVSAVMTDIVSDERGEVDMAYHVWTNCPPPMLSCDSLGANVNPAESLTEKVVPDWKQSHPTIITSFDCAVVNERLHVVTYPHPLEAEPSRAIEEDARTAGASKTTIDKTELTIMRLIPIARYWR